MNIRISVLIPLIFLSACSSPQAPRLATDSLSRPPNISEFATLLNFGSEDEKIFVWADPIGPLIYNEKEYPHIQGVKFYYVTAKQTSVLYYENFKLRNDNKKWDFRNSKILNYPGDATLELTNGNDTLLVFWVLETREFERVYNGILFKGMPTIYPNWANQYAADVMMEFNIVRNDTSTYILTVTDGTKIAYKLCSRCDKLPQMVSFLNRKDGRIYFIEKECYLELVNKEDVKKFQGLR